jgi:hypothetical protein
MISLKFPETVSGHPWAELVSAIPCHLIIEIASKGDANVSACRFATQALYRLERLLLSDPTVIIDSKCIGQLLHAGRNEVLSSMHREEHQAVNPRYLPTDLSSEILHMEVPSNETSDSATRIAMWALFAQACQSAKVMDLHATHAGRIACSTDVASKPFVGKPASMVWLVEAPFVDPDPKVRKHMATRLGQVLLRNDACVFLCLFANRKEMNSLTQDDSVGNGSTAAIVVSRAFHEIDRLMFKFCQIPQSQFSFTMAHTSASESTCTSMSETRQKQTDETIDFQYAAIEALASLCRGVNPSSSFGRLVFEYSFVRLLRFWTSMDNTSRASDSSPDSIVSIAALAFQAIMRISANNEVGHLLKLQGKEIYAPILFVDLLLPCTTYLVSESSGDCDPMGREIRKRQYDMIFNFIGSFLVKQPSGFPQSLDAMQDHESLAFEVSAFFDDSVRFIFPQLILENDYDTLRLTTGFNLFLWYRQKQIEKQESLGAIDARDYLIGSPLGSATKIRGVDATRGILEEQTKLLCLHPSNIGLILPRLLASDMSDRRSSPLVFFLETVIKRTVTLKEMIQFETSKMLGNILWELCLDDQMELSATQAIRSAAATLDRYHGASGVSGSGSNQLLTEVASKWVSANFLSLTVNIVQQKWRSRSTEERVRGLRCLKIMLQFLLPAEAPQFLPQMLATVNMAMSGETANRAQTSTLRLFAVRILSQYLRLWADDQSETLGQNLTTVIVSLFPVIPSNSTNPPEEEAGRVAVSLLEWLSSGTLGKKLAVFFKEIPFLPQSTALDRVRDSLQSLGIDFNNSLVITSTQGLQYGLTERDSLTSEGGLVSDGWRTAAESLQAQKSLQRRIRVLCPLFEHESASVRKVALQYLTNLLRANRCLFYKLVETEEQSPAALFLTETYDNEVNGVSGTKFIKGRVALMVETLLRRCGAEDDEDAQLSLATSLGEIGAIDGNRLGELSVGDSKRNDRSCLGEISRSWQLAQPPWKSRPARYELQLVTKHLVGALKAAPDSTDLDRIAFTIQQLLGNLDMDARRGSDTLGKAIRVDCAAENVSSNERGPMSQWLREQLLKADVLEMMEPFWASRYKDASSKMTTEKTPPPFFKNAPSYFVWLSTFCRYMIRRSKISGNNMWTEFFFACRTAIRSSAGLAIAEFILPLLILDRLCSDIKEDEDAILSELRDVLYQHLPEQNVDFSATNRMSHGDQQKAVNIVFSILDTLQWWAEREIEDRHKSSSRHSSSSSTHSSGPLSETRSEWSANESLGKIETLLEAIPLELRAKAATSVGMHARALQCLELLARANIVQDIFDSPTQTRSEQRGLSQISRQRKGHITDGLDKRFLKKVLGNLDDYDTMSAVPKPEMEVFGEDTIIEREARGDFEGAYNDYERCLQVENSLQKRSKLEEGALRCLLELGQFENVLNQVKGMMHRPERIVTSGDEAKFTSDKDMISSHSIPFAVEAAWKLGRWGAMDDLLAAANGLEDVFDVSTTYHLSLGKLMLGLQQRSQRLVDTSLASGRMSTLSALSNMSRESYSRSYPYLVRLQCLREIEDASQIFAGEVQNLSEMTNAATGLDWNDRLDVVSTLKSTTIIDVRSALARLANDTALEGSLHLTKGMKARKSGMYKVAANSFAKAASTISQTNRAKDKHSMIELADFMGSVQMQLAKLQHNVGESEAALQILGDDDVRGWLDIGGGGHAQKFALERDASAMSILLKSTGHDVANSDRFAKRLLQSTQWMVEGGLKGVSELTERFRVAHELAPKWEKGHFQYAKYVDSILETRITALAKRGADRVDSVDDDATRSLAVFKDGNCQVYLKLAIEQYIEALKLGEKHVYLALPRLLSLWFEFTGIPVDGMMNILTTDKESKDTDYKTTRKSSESKGKHDFDAVCHGHIRRSHTATAQSLHEHYARGN